MNVLIVQLSFIGDVILSSPIIAAVKALYPHAKISFLTTKIAAELLMHEENLEEILIFDKRGNQSGFKGLTRAAQDIKKREFDVIFSAHRSLRTSLMLYLSGCKRRVGFKDAVCSFLYTERVERDRAPHAVKRYFSILQHEKGYGSLFPVLKLTPPPSSEISGKLLPDLQQSYIAVFPGSEWETKRYARYREVIQELIARGEKIIVLGSKKEASLNEAVTKDLHVINLTGATSLVETAYIVSGAKGVVCNDSMSLHLASSFSVPTVALFCATSPSFGFGPVGARSQVLEAKNLPCKPCKRHGSRVCPTRTNLCRTLVSPHAVADKIISLAEMKEVVVQ